jgi:hypothetical protein
MTAPKLHITLAPSKYPAPRYILGWPDPQGKETAVEISGFENTQAMLTWIDQNWAQHGESYILVGYWEVDDAGTKYEFDGEEIYAGTSWEEFKQDHMERLEEEAEDNRRWREEIAREEGMLNGISSYNDWMGC